MSGGRLAKRASNRARDLLFAPGTEPLWRRRLKGRIMVLVYHRVDDSERYGFLDRGGTPVIAPRELAKELKWLRDGGARFFTLAQMRAGKFPRDDEVGIVVSFDDGFRDNYTNGLEVLDSLGIKGVFFQCSAMIGARRLIPEHALYRFASCAAASDALLALARARCWPGTDANSAASLTVSIGRWIRQVPAGSLKEVIATLRERFPDEEPAAALYPAAQDILRAGDRGHEIGSHGHEHLHRATLDDVGFEHQLSTSVAVIERATGRRPAAFSYPFSGYLPGDREVCARHFKQALTVDETLVDRDTDPLAMGRFSWPGSTGNGFRKRRWLLTGTI